MVITSVVWKGPREEIPGGPRRLQREVPGGSTGPGGPRREIRGGSRGGSRRLQEVARGSRSSDASKGPGGDQRPQEQSGLKNSNEKLSFYEDTSETRFGGVPEGRSQGSSREAPEGGPRRLQRLKVGVLPRASGQDLHGPPRLRTKVGSTNTSPKRVSTESKSEGSAWARREISKIGRF